MQGHLQRNGLIFNTREIAMEIKKLLRSLGLLALFLAVVFGINLTVDPANILNRKYAGEAARILLTAGAKEVHLGCIAAAAPDNK